MSNLHLKNKGLLSLILFLPDDWNYIARGLADICKEGVDSISGALKALEQAGYIVRYRLQNDKSPITDIEYAMDGRQSKLGTLISWAARTMKHPEGTLPSTATIYEAEAKCFRSDQQSTCV